MANRIPYENLQNGGDLMAKRMIFLKENKFIYDKNDACYQVLI